MNVWTWVLAGLCVAGFALAAGSVVPVVKLALKLNKRVQDLQHSRLFDSLEVMQMQAKRLSKAAAQAAPLAERMQAVTASLQTSKEQSGIENARRSLSAAGADIEQLLHDLR